MPALAASDPAEQLAGLFMQSCLVYAGDPPAMRAWARQTGLAEVPEPARGAFLHGASGMVFDASNTSGKFVVISADQGTCSTLTDAADGASVLAALESDLGHAGIAFRTTGERDDSQDPALHYRDYTAVKSGYGWRIVAATVKARQPGQAMLTADADRPP